MFVAMRRNVAELPDLVRLAGRWGIKRMWVQNLSHSFSDTHPAGDYARLGDVGSRSFAEVWNDEPYRAFRRALLTDTPPDVCRGCLAYRRVF